MFSIRKIILINMFLLTLLLTPWQINNRFCQIQNVYASSQEHASSGHGEKKDSHGGGHYAHHGPPVKYYIHWIALLTALGSVVIYLKRKSSHKEAHYIEHDVHEEHGGHVDDEDEGGGHHGIHVVQEAKRRALLLCGLVIFMFFIEYAPSLAGYHESVSISLLKFATKMALGVCLTAFGILGMDEH